MFTSLFDTPVKQRCDYFIYHSFNFDMQHNINTYFDKLNRTVFIQLSYKLDFKNIYKQVKQKVVKYLIHYYHRFFWVF